MWFFSQYFYKVVNAGNSNRVVLRPVTVGYVKQKKLLIMVSVCEHIHHEYFEEIVKTPFIS